MAENIKSKNQKKRSLKSDEKLKNTKEDRLHEIAKKLENLDGEISKIHVSGLSEEVFQKANKLEKQRDKLRNEFRSLAVEMPSDAAVETTIVISSNRQSDEPLGRSKEVAIERRKMVERSEKLLQEAQNERHKAMPKDGILETTLDLTARGTPRKNRPMRKSEEIGGDPTTEQFAAAVKLGGRIPHDLRSQFIECAKKMGVTQSVALEQAIEQFLENNCK